MPCGVSYAGTSHILKSWKRLLKDPRDILLNAYFLNIVGVALVELEKMAKSNNSMSKGQNTWKGKLLKRLV